MSGAGGRRWRLVRASGDVVPASVRRLARVAWRHRVRRVAPWAGAGLVVALLAGWVLWASPLLGVREVQVIGAAVLSPADVRQAAGVAESTPMARVPTDQVAARVAALPPVADVEVRRAWPDTIVIEVRERAAVAAVPGGAGYRLVDSTGVVFHEVASAPADLPVLEVAKPGPDDPSTLAALTVLAALTPPLAAQLARVEGGGPVRIRLILHSGRTIVWGDESASDEKARVATALLDQDADEIDVSTPEVVVLR